MKRPGKIGKVLREFKKGKLHSGSKHGALVTSRKQAVAIAMSEAGMSKSMKNSAHGSGAFTAQDLCQGYKKK